MGATPWKLIFLASLTSNRCNLNSLSRSLARSLALALARSLARAPPYYLPPPSGG